MWCALGLAVSTVQNMACFFAGSAIGAAADVLSGQSVGHWSDKGGYVSLPAGCFSLIGALVWTSRAAKQAQEADDPTRHNRPSLRNGAQRGALAGLVVGGLAGMVGLHFGGLHQVTTPTVVVSRMLTMLAPGVLLLGAEMGCLDIALSRRRGGRPLSETRTP